MLRKINDIKGFKLGARDGEIGRAKEFYFTDRNWTVRYLVADTGKWLPGRQVLLSPHAIRAFDDNAKTVVLDLTKERIEKSPSIDHDKPVSRQFEEEYYRYYHYPVYWQGPGMWGPLPRPGLSYGQVTGPLQQTWPPEHPPDEVPGDPHLRSTREVAGYHIQASDGRIGHVEDFILNDEDWAIEYLVVDTVDWWPGKKVLACPNWVTAVDWHKSTLSLSLDRNTIKAAPEYDPSTNISRDYEERLFSHYGKPCYWSREAA